MNKLILRMNNHGWLRFEIIVITFVVYAALLFLVKTVGWDIHPFVIFLVTLGVLFLWGVSPDLVRLLKRGKNARSDE